MSNKIAFKSKKNRQAIAQGNQKIDYFYLPYLASSIQATPGRLELSNNLCCPYRQKIDKCPHLL